MTLPKSRLSQRPRDALRPVSFALDFCKYAEGSCLVKFGDTHVLCTASLTERPPPWLRGQGRGWITAEYGMLPRSTHTRMNREAVSGKQGGRTQEIQRLIGRSLRSIVDLKALGERQIVLDCDVIQADGGTRTAAITGAWVALAQCLTRLHERGLFLSFPLKGHVASVSAGLWNGQPVLDLDYEEDSTAQADANFVMTDQNTLIEVQATAEQSPFTQEEFQTLLSLASKGIKDLIISQKQALSA